MNNEDTPATHSIPTSDSAKQASLPTPETLVQPPVDTTSGDWVAKEQYDFSTAEAEKQRVSEMSKNSRIRSFYILLAISGFLLFVMYMGMLIWPLQYFVRGSCSENFIGIAFWLNPLSYVFLLTTGIVGSTIKYRAIRPLSITFIVVSPIGWFITGVVIIASSMCGV